MESPFFACEGRVIVLQDEAETISSGGIIIPDAAKEAPAFGIVVHVGPGEYLESGAKKDPPCDIGAHVVFGKYAGTTVEHHGRDYKILSYIEVLAVVR